VKATLTRFKARHKTARGATMATKSKAIKSGKKLVAGKKLEKKQPLVVATLKTF
jgi:hypothetical protein